MGVEELQPAVRVHGRERERERGLGVGEAFLGRGRAAVPDAAQLRPLRQAVREREDPEEVAAHVAPAERDRVDLRVAGGGGRQRLARDAGDARRQRVRPAAAVAAARGLARVLAEDALHRRRAHAQNLRRGRLVDMLELAQRGHLAVRHGHKVPGRHASRGAPETQEQGFRPGRVRLPAPGVIAVLPVAGQQPDGVFALGPRDLAEVVDRGTLGLLALQF